MHALGIVRTRDVTPGEAVRCGGRGGVRRSRRCNGTVDGDRERRGGRGPHQGSVGDGAVGVEEEGGDDGGAAPVRKRSGEAVATAVRGGETR